MLDLLVVMTIILVLVSLLMGAAYAIRRGQTGNNTLIVMGQATLVTNRLVNGASAIQPDHRLANFYFVQPHVTDGTTTPQWDSARARSMSSSEFLVYLAMSNGDTAAMLRTAGETYLKSPAPPANWPASYTGNGRSWPDGKGNLLVDVFTLNPSQPSLVYRWNCPTTVNGAGAPAAPVYALVSGRQGYMLLGLYDGWGREMLYRSYVSPGILEGKKPDGVTVEPAYTTAPANAQSLQALETITGDRNTDPLRPDKGLGEAVNGDVMPALAASDHPYFISAGQDGLWGSFKDPAVRDALADPAAARDAAARDNLYSFDRFGR